MFRAVARNAPRNDLAPLRGEMSQFVPLFVVKILDLIGAKAADFSSYSSFLVFLLYSLPCKHPSFPVPADFQPVLLRLINERFS